MGNLKRNQLHCYLLRRFSFFHTHVAQYTTKLGLINAEQCYVRYLCGEERACYIDNVPSEMASTLCSFFYGTVLVHKLNALLTAAALAAF